MTQLELFTQSETDDQSYHVVIPANPLVKPGSAEAVKMTDTSGRKYFPLFSKSDQIGLFVKTFLATSLWASTRCFLTWQTKPITQSKHFILELYPSMPHIEECDFGSSQEMWATPTTMEHLPAGISGSFKESKSGRRKRSSNLRDQVNPETVEAWEKAQEPQMWPTPDASPRGARRNQNGHQVTLQDAVAGLTPETAKYHQVAMYPTPTASLEKHSTKEAYWENRIQKGRQEDIQMRVYKETGSGSLNPNWVEWLMGYPDGWTSLETYQE